MEGAWGDVHDLVAAAGWIGGAWIVLSLPVALAFGAMLRRLTGDLVDMTDDRHLDPAQLQYEVVFAAKARH